MKHKKCYLGVHLILNIFFPVICAMEQEEIWHKQVQKKIRTIEDIKNEGQELLQFQPKNLAERTFLNTKIHTLINEIDNNLKFMSHKDVEDFLSLKAHLTKRLGPKLKRAEEPSSIWSPKHMDWSSK